MSLFWIVALIFVADYVICDTSVKVKFPIVYVYTVTKNSCEGGLPEYIRVSLEQAALLQSDCDVVMASNYAECATIEKNIKDIPNVTLLDVSLISSPRTKDFTNAAFEIFGYGDLWTTSATRFFHLEDYMIRFNMTELLHVEADNLLYRKVSKLLRNF